MNTLNIPAEIILLVVEFFEFEADINSLCRVNRHLYSIVNRVLYKWNAQNRRRLNALEWGVSRGSVGTIGNCIAAGADFHNELLHEAADHGHNHVIDLLLSSNRSDGNERTYNFDINGRFPKTGETPLALAVHSGQTSTVRKLLELGARVDVIDFEGNSLLTFAAYEGNPTIVKMLMAAGCVLDPGQEPHLQPLMVAASSGHLAALEILTQARGSDAKNMVLQRNEALRAAARNGHTNIVLFLIQMGVGPDIPIPIQDSPLYLAVSGRHEATVQCLLDCGALPTLQVLFIAARRGVTKIVQMLMQHMKDDPTTVESDLEQHKWIYSASACRSPDYLTKFISKGWNVGLEVPGAETPLECAAQKGHVEIVRLLLLHGANPYGEQGDGDALACAIKHGHSAIVEMLLDHGANPNSLNNMGVPVIFTAIPFEPIFGLLLERGADPHSYARALSYHGERLLSSEVIRVGTAAETLMLIERGVAFNCTAYRDENGCSADQGISLTERLAGSLDPAILNTLMDHNQFDPQPGGDDEQDALLHACSYGNPTLLQLLIARGFNVCNPKWQANILFSVVSKSPQRNVAAMVDLLLEEGVDINTPDEQGRTALMRLLSSDMSGREAAVSILLQRGAFLSFRLWRLNDHPLLNAHPYIRESILRAIDERGIFMEAEPYLRSAIEMAGETEIAIRPLERFAIRPLERFYWRRRYPV